MGRGRPPSPLFFCHCALLRAATALSLSNRHLPYKVRRRRGRLRDPPTRGSRMQNRAQWQSRLGFVLAATGSAVGLGNIWKFPYITGVNGGGLFVLIYLVCIAAVGIPILAAEVLLGRATANSPVGAFRTVAGKGSPWILVGGLGVLTAGTILSYYGVVAGWCLEYVFVSLSGALARTETEAIPELFGALYASGTR